jgi:hypothetical protein
MTFRYPKWLAFIRFAAAFAMLIALYVGTNPKFWGWLLFAPLFLFIVYEGMRAYTYSLTVGDDLITIGGFEPAQYPISEISDVKVWDAKGRQIAVVSFVDRRKFSFPSYLVGFADSVELIRTRAKLEKPALES